LELLKEKKKVVEDIKKEIHKLEADVQFFEEKNQEFDVFLPSFLPPFFLSSIHSIVLNLVLSQILGEYFEVGISEKPIFFSEKKGRREGESD